MFGCLQEKFVLCNYMPKQPSLNPEMRAILIDWLVEVQVSFPTCFLSLCYGISMPLRVGRQFICLLKWSMLINTLGGGLYKFNFQADNCKNHTLLAAQLAAIN